MSCRRSVRFAFQFLVMLVFFQPVLPSFPIFQVLPAFAESQSPVQPTVQPTSPPIAEQTAKQSATSPKSTMFWEASPISSVAGLEQLVLDFSAAYDKCRNLYDDNWYFMCMPPDGLNLGGKPGRGFSLNPPIKGTWRWQYNGRLLFMPDGPWTPNQKYEVAMDETALPVGVEYIGQTLSFTTPILEVQQAKWNFMHNPTSIMEMGLQGNLTFSYPVDKKSVEQNLSFVLPEATDKALLGKPVYTWNNDSTTLLFSLPVLSLAQYDTSVVLNLPDYLDTLGNHAYAGQFIQMQVPGTKTLFKVTTAQLENSTNPKLQAEQVLNLEFTCQVDPAQVAAHISAILLPRQRIAEAGTDAAPYKWWNLEEITKEVLADSPPLSLKLMGDGKPSTTVSFTYEAEPKRGILLTLDNKLQSHEKLPLGGGRVNLLTVPDLPEELRIMQQGSVLNLAGDKSLSLYSRNLDSIRYSVGQVRPEFVNHLLSQYSGQFFTTEKKYYMDVDSLAIFHRGELPLVKENPLHAQFSALSLGTMIENAPIASPGKGIFAVMLTGIRNNKPVAEEKRFVLVTDLGIIHKQQANGISKVFVASLSQGKAVAGADVQVLGRNGMPVFQGRTDAEGSVSLPDFAGLQAEKTAVGIVVSQGQDLSFLPINQSQRILNYSRSDVGGHYSQLGGLNALLFSQRDLYRPGDTLHFGFIVKQSNWQSLEKLPLKAILRDPGGYNILEVPLRLGAEGLGEVRYALPQNARSGAYYLDLLLAGGKDDGAGLATAMVKVEDFQPDTQRMSLKLDPEPVAESWIKPQSMELEVSLNNLFGAPAPDRKVQAHVLLSPVNMHFDEYADWFFPGNGVWSVQEFTLEETRTNADGLAIFRIPVEKLNQLAAKSYMMSIYVQGFDASGSEAITSTISTLISPMDSVLAYRSDENLTHYLRQGSAAQVEVRAFDSTLKAQGVDKLKLEMVRRTSTRTLVRDNEGQYRYEMLDQEEVVDSKDITLPAEGLILPLDTKEPGNKALVLRNAKGEVVLHAPYSVAGEATAQMDSQRDASIQARLNKDTYNSGDAIEIALTLPYSGAGLITLEREEVLSHQWFQAPAGESVQSIILPGNFEGRGFVNIMFFRAQDDKDIFTPPLAYHALPFNASNSLRNMGLSVESPEKASPGKPLEIVVRAEKPGKALVYAVDEGILQLSYYQKPDPLDVLLNRRGLQVTTAQYFDQLMPEYRLMRQAFGFGGGDGLGSSPSQGANPFRREGEKPMAFWSGLVDVGPAGTNVSIDIPPYFNGSVRIMAVSCSLETVASAQDECLIQAEVVIQPNLPVFAAPGDTFTATVTLTYMGDKEEEDISLSVEASSGIQVLNPNSLPAQLKLVKGKEQRLLLPMQTSQDVGPQSVVFKASTSAGTVVQYPTSLSLRPIMSFSQQVLMGRAADNLSLDLSRQLHKQSAQVQASLSALPLPAAQALIRYLESYPLDCTEQVISAAFPALALLAAPELTPAPAWDKPNAYKPEELKKNILQAMQVLMSRSDYDGWRLWPQGRISDNINLIAYAADFLTTAKEQGILVPPGLMVKAITALQEACRNLPESIEEARGMAYGAWVLTRNGEITSPILSTLAAWLDQKHPQKRDDIASSFMAACHKMLRQDAQASELIQQYKTMNNTTPFWASYLDSLSIQALHLTLVARHFPELLTQPDTNQRYFSMLDSLVDLAGRQQFNTFSAAQTVRALFAISEALPSPKPGESKVALNSGQGLEATPLPTTLSQSSGMLSTQASGEQAASVGSISFSHPGNFYWQVSSGGFDKNSPTEALFEGLEVRRQILNLDGTPLPQPYILKQGEEYLMALFVRSYGQAQEDIAVVDLLPAGLAPVLSRNGAILGTGNLEMGMNALETTYINRREDRIILIASPYTEERSYIYRVRAQALGTYTMPPLQAESMYKPGIRACGLKEKVEVKDIK